MRPAGFRLLDTVALLTDQPSAGLRRGQVGTVVELLDERTYEVEFSDADGQTYAMLAVPSEELIVLRFELAG